MKNRATVELSIMEGFLEEAASKLRLEEWEGDSQAGRGSRWGAVASMLMVAVESGDIEGVKAMGLRDSACPG